jgi:putative endonuclease
MNLIRYRTNDFQPTSFSALVDQFFNDTVSRNGGSTFHPKTDVAETDQAFEIYLAVPGSADGTLYAGITTALERRLAAHNAGAASKYTRARRPVRLVWAEACTDRSAASRREAVIKALPRMVKLALADGRAATPPPARSRRGSAAASPAGSKR